MILVTGATGTTGSEVTRQLLDRGEAVRTMSRGETTIDGAQHVRADYDDANSLVRAVEGVSAVYLVTAPPRPTIDHDAAMVAAATAAGVDRLVKLSAISGADPDTWHARSEQPTRSSGLGWTVLRPSTFASNLLWYAPMIKNGAPLPNSTADGAIGVIDPRDIAAVAVAALTTADHIEQTYTLTGPELLTFPQQIAVLERALGTTIGVDDVPLTRVRATMIDNGTDPEQVAEIITGMARTAAGRYAVVSDDVARVLGRAPGGLDDWANDHRHAFA